MEVIISFLFGMLPEIIYFTLSVLYIRNKKEKQIKLFLLIMMAYILCITIIRFKVVNYLIFMIVVHLIQRILYKDTSKIDIFVFSIPVCYVTMLASIILLTKEDYSNYWILFAINRIMLFLPFIFIKKFNKLYLIYKELWNRNEKEKRRLKSITVRNSSLIILNFLIFSINSICFFIVAISGGD